MHHNRLTNACELDLSSIYGTRDISTENSKGSLYQKPSVYKFSDNPETKLCL